MDLVHANSRRYHLMIVGIDAYPKGIQSLNGCVRDAEKIVSFLLTTGVPEKAVYEGLFLAPPPGRTVEIPFKEELSFKESRYKAPTYANLKARLEEIAQNAEPGDHVWIFYSGHGTQRPHPNPTSCALYEALVPMDFDFESGGNLLYDFELARLLRDMGTGKRIDSITVILDCCNSAGATRNIPVPTQVQWVDRYIELPKALLAKLPPISLSAEDRQGLVTIGDQVAGDPTVVAACHADERAREDRATGEYQGILTVMLLQLLEGRRQEGQSLDSLRWADIWQELRRGVEARNPAQHPWILGSIGRPCLGGRGLPYDAGLPIVAPATATDSYLIEAGSLLGVHSGALIGVYEVDPPLFEPLNSRADIAQRTGTLLVEKATLLSAQARPLSSAAFRLPRTARGRLCTTNLSVYLTSDAARQLDTELLMELAKRYQLALKLCPAGTPAELVVDRLSDGCYVFGDEINPPHGVAEGGLPMATIPGELPIVEILPLLVRGFLHYAQYATALRMARLAQLTEGGSMVLRKDALQVDLVACSALSKKERILLHQNLHARRPMPRSHSGAYQLRVASLDHASESSPDVFAIWLRNRTSFPMFVSIFDCNCDGQIEELLLNEQVPDGEVGKLIWLGGEPGAPIDLRLSGQRQRGVDRLLVIASTVKGGHGLESLKQENTLQGAIDIRSRGADHDRPVARSTSASNPVTAWTALELNIDMRRQ